MEYEILVQLKGEVLDPEGRAIQETLQNQGVSSIKSIQVAKRYVVEIEADPSRAETIAKDIAERYLANPVAQTYSVRRLPS